MYFACNMPHYSPYELVNPAKIAAVAGFLPSYLDFSDRLLVCQIGFTTAAAETSNLNP